jgi:rare lipoprotein A
MSSTGPKTLRLIPIILVLAVVAGCAGSPARPPAGSQQAVASANAGSRGNPPFYDVFGERYYVLTSSEGYRENGIASWYGQDFDGMPTSSGEIYDMYKLTAAHKTLPIPTWVEVTNLANGRSVVVKVNDRGPFVDGRVIDLSLRAAEELDMIRNGTARVQVRALGTSPPEVAPPLVARAAPESQSTPRRGISIISTAAADTVRPDDRLLRPLYVQVGAFADRNNANRLAERLKDVGFKDSFVLTSGQGRDRLHRVRIGPIADAAEFDRIRAGLDAVGVQGPRLVQDN